jgi:hypothetical protein
MSLPGKGKGLLWNVRSATSSQIAGWRFYVGIWFVSHAQDNFKHRRSVLFVEQRSQDTSDATLLLDEARKACQIYVNDPDNSSEWQLPRHIL